MGRKKSAALRGGKLIRVSGACDALAGAGPTPGLNPRNSAQSVSSTMEDMAGSVRKLLANFGNPIEEINKGGFIPKIQPKENKIFIFCGEKKNNGNDGPQKQ